MGVELGGRVAEINMRKLKSKLTKKCFAEMEQEMRINRKKEKMTKGEEDSGK
jgi:hypothetical protein